LSADEVAEELMKDPSLAATVLKTINSAYYGFEKKISEIRYAIVLLGFDSIYQIVIAEGVKRTMPDTPAFKELLMHSIIISHLASEISHVTEIGSPPEIATIGLLHELGQVVIQLLKDKNPKLSNLINVLDRAQMGSLLLKTWNLPDVIWQSVEFQSYPEFTLPEKIPGDVRSNAAIIHLAHLCYEVFRGRTEEELPVTFLDEYAQLLQWESLPVGKIAKRKLLPGLSLKYKTLPAPLRQLLKPHIK
jgi:HD-like signal output (HDOD) protein